MANLNAVIVPAKVLKNGRHKIRISVSHNGETRYIVTDIIIDSEKEFKNGSIVRRADAAMVNTKIRGLIQRFQEIIDRTDYVNGLSCPELVALIKNTGYGGKSTLRTIYDEYMENSTAKQQSLDYYESCWKAISSHINENIPLTNIKLATLLGLEKYLRQRKLSASTIHNYLTFFKTLLNYAKLTGRADFRIDPFAGYKMPASEVRECWLSVEEIKKIRDFDIKSHSVRKCRDIFMLSYYLGGINQVDLFNIDFNENAEVLCYVREKTKDCPKRNKFVEFRIPDEAKALIEKYKCADGKLAVSKCSFRHFCDYNIAQLSKATGIKNLVYYSARKSFSQHAFLLGVNTAVIDYILGHKVDKPTMSLYSYIKVTPDMATKAVRMVLDGLK